MRTRRGILCLGFVVLSGVASAAPSLSPPDAQMNAPGLSYDPREADLPIAVRLDDGVEFKPYHLTELEPGSFAESAPGGQAAGLDLRRQQLGAELYAGGQVNLGAVWDFGGSPGSLAEFLHVNVTGGPSPRTANGFVGALIVQF